MFSPISPGSLCQPHTGTNAGYSSHRNCPGTDPFGRPAYRGAAAHAYALSDQYSLSNPYPGAYGNSLPYRHTEAHLHALPYTYPYSDTDAYPHPYANTDAVAYGNPRTNRHANAYDCSHRYPVAHANGGAPIRVGKVYAQRLL